MVRRRQRSHPGGVARAAASRVGKHVKAYAAATVVAIVGYHPDAASQTFCETFTQIAMAAPAYFEPLKGERQDQEIWRGIADVPPLECIVEVFGDSPGYYYCGMPSSTNYQAMRSVYDQLKSSAFSCTSTLGDSWRIFDAGGTTARSITERIRIEQLDSLIEIEISLRYRIDRKTWGVSMTFDWITE